MTFFSALPLALTLAAGPAPAPRCPAPAAVRKRLALPPGPWKTTCRPDGDRLLLGGVRPGPEGPAATLVVGIASGRDVKRGEIVLRAKDDPQLAAALAPGRDWRLMLTSDRLGGDPVVRAGLLATSDGKASAAYEIVAFLRAGPRALTPLWTGLGDWEEPRAGACLLDARATFRITAGGALERTTQTRRRLLDVSIGQEPGAATSAAPECLVPPLRREEFPLPPG